MAHAPYKAGILQLGRETVPGTAVAATTVWGGKFADPVEDIATTFVDQEVGMLAPVLETYTTGRSATLDMPETEVTFEQLPHIFEAGIKTATPSGAGPYVYLYEMPTTALPTIKTYTIEAGNKLVVTDVREMKYSFVTAFTLSGEYNAAWMVSATWMGQQVDPTTLTAALTVPTREVALFGNTILYLDDGGGTIGTTAVAGGVLRGASIEVNTGLAVVPAVNGTLTYSAHKSTEPEVTFSIEVELEDGEDFVETERAKRLANTTRLIRLVCTGTSDRELQIDLAGRWESVDGYTNSDGNTVVTLNGRAAYSIADATYAEFQVTNNLATIP